ncbi:nucleoporin Nup186/Nup192/Nup205 [Radiomyces spectabilis]|uniref:nucleoporin Nup186/Nup192/Nup205 n=1 Tax=Radiomyces spectabilis TaxID=64574 RepID=UPI002221124B|nr:nucleoporin Nup186/Nup192/Nup205 [Radiomyces spectabilis]KAI8366687.1 nucleoporin Nup186/Nup192/Nup205 [Radiomyces spectabilis]
MFQLQTIPTWTAASQALQDAIAEARVSNSVAADNGLLQQLQQTKPLLRSLLDNEPKNAEHRTMLQTGKTYINRVMHKVNDEFTKQAIALSDLLDINEYEASTLLFNGTREAVTHQEDSISASIKLYYTERGYLLASIDAILKSAKDASLDDAKRDFFRHIAMELMDTNYASNTQTEKCTLVGKLLQAIQQLGKAIDVAKKGTDTSTTTTTTTQMATASTLSTTAFNSAPAASPSITVSEEMKSYRQQHMIDERIQIAQLLYHLASLFWLDAKDILALVDDLKNLDLADVTTPYLLVAMIACLSCSQDKLNSHAPLLNDLSSLQSLDGKIKNDTWKVPSMQSVLILQWVILIQETMHDQSQLIERLKMDEEQRETWVDKAISGNALEFLNHYVLYFQHDNVDASESDHQESNASVDMVVDGLSTHATDFLKCHASIWADFRQFVIYELEKMALTIIDEMADTLQKLKYEEEDSNLTVKAPLSSKVAFVSMTSTAEQSHHLEAFYNLLANVYRHRVNAGSIFWDIERVTLYRFVKWSADIKLAATVRACYDFFGSIATGDQCAPHVFAFFNLGTNKNDLASSHLFSWGKLVSALQFYAPLLNKGTDDGMPAILRPAEEDLLLKFLNLLKQVVRYCVEARTAFWNEPETNLQRTLIELLNCPTSSNVRSSLYNVLAAFCSSTGEGIHDVGRAIALDIWEMLEHSDLFSSPRSKLRPITSDNNFVSQQSLIYEDVESRPGLAQMFSFEGQHMAYPQTLSVLHLLSSAIHTPTRREEIMANFEPTPPSIPSTLGQTTSIAGAGHFISVMIDTVFLTLNEQSYVHPRDKWQLTEACLNVMENSVLCFDTRPITEWSKQKNTSLSSRLSALSLANNPSMGAYQQAMVVYLTHPGFEVISRILSGSNLTVKLFEIIEQATTSRTLHKSKGYYLDRCVVRCLRILDYVLKIQDVFGSLLIPSIVEASQTLPSGDIKIGDRQFPALRSLAPLGHLMLYHKSVLPKLACLINHDQEEVCFLSAHILKALTASERQPSAKLVSQSDTYIGSTTIGSKIAEILKASPELSSIIYSVSERLAIDEPQVVTYDDYDYDPNNIAFWLAEKTLTDTSTNSDTFVPRLSTSVQLTLLDLLLQNAGKDQPSPSLSDVLLGLEVLEPKPHVIRQETRHRSAQLLTLNALVDLMKEEGQIPLMQTHPLLAEKCLAAIYHICSRESFTRPVMRYLRFKDFFNKQLLNRASRFETNVTVDHPVVGGTILCSTGERITTDFTTLRSVIYQHSWLLKIIALELRVFAGQSHILYGKQADSDTNNEAVEARRLANLFTADEDVQPLMRMLDMLDSLEFKWIDDLSQSLQNFQPETFEGFQSKSFETTDDSGCTMYDIRAVYQHLRQRQTEKEKEPNFTDDDRLAFEDNIGRVLQYLMAENHARELSHAKMECLQGWKQAVKMILTHSFDYLPFETREKITYDLLHILLPKLRKSKTLAGDILESLSELVVALLSRLQEDKRRQSVLHMSPDIVLSGLPKDKLCSVFASILDCVQTRETSVILRGNMYTAMVMFLQYVHMDNSNNQGALSDIVAEITHLVLYKNPDALDVLCADATDGYNAWKTTAYAALNTLCTLTTRDRQNGVEISSFLVKKNFLSYSIEMLEREDKALVEIIDQRDALLMPLMIFEAKLAFFLRLALIKQSAGLLFERGIMERLGQCTFLNQQEKFQSPRYDSSTCNGLQRYDRMLLPVLALVVALCSHLAPSDEFQLKKIEYWVKKQPSLVVILRDEQNYVSLTTLQKLDLISLIMYRLSCRPGYFDDMTTQGLDDLHSAMISLCAKYLLPDFWLPKLIPTTEEEHRWAKQIISAADAKSLLSLKAQETVMSIQKNLLAYAQNNTFAGSVTSPLKPIISHHMDAKEVGRAALVNASMRTPSLGMLFSALRHTARALREVLSRYSILSSQKENVASLRYEEIREIANTAIPKDIDVKYDLLNPNQQQHLLATEIATRLKRKREHLQSLLFIAEHLLLIAWRHLEFYTNPSLTTHPTPISFYEVETDDWFRVPTQTTLFRSTPETARQVKALSPTTIEPVLEKLQSLEWPASLPGSSGEAIASFCDRIRRLYQ